MGHLILIIIASALLIGFVVLTQYEAQYGLRFFSARREELDMRIKRIELIMEHVDLAAFARDEIRYAMDRIGHAIAHLSLQIVRAVERLLTRLVRHFRARNEDYAAPRESAREFVKTLSDFKDGLKATHPDIDSLEVK